MRGQVKSGMQRWSQIRQDLGRRFARKLFDEVAQAGSDKRLSVARRASRSYWIANAVAALIHLSGFAFGVAGLLLLVSAGWNLVLFVPGLLLLLLAWIARPRLGQKPHRVLKEVDFPTLHATVRRLAVILNAPQVAGIEASADFGASYMSAGWRQHRYMTLGAPLMAILNREERLAVIAHELSHGANGDPMRGVFLFGAVGTLSNWADGIRPTSLGRSADEMPSGPVVSLFAVPIELAMLALSESLYLCAKGLVLLVLRESQRAEYLADLLAAGAVGTRAMVDGLEKTYLEREVDAASRRLALTHPDGSLEAELANEVAQLGIAELQKHRESSAAELWQVDSTHPPTAMRVAMLRTVPESTPALVLSYEEGQAFDNEMSRLIELQQREVVNRKLEAIYG